MDAYGASDQAGRGMRRVDRVRCGPLDQIRSTCLNPCVITATIKSQRGASRSSDQDPTDAILSVFKRLSTDQIVTVHHDPTVTT